MKITKYCMSPTWLVLIGSSGSSNKSHTYPIAAPNQPLVILRHDIPRMFWVCTKIVRTVDITHISYSQSHYNYYYAFTITFGSWLLWGQGYCVKSVCMNGILADSHRVGPCYFWWYFSTGLLLGPRKQFSFFTHLVMLRTQDYVHREQQISRVIAHHYWYRSWAGAVPHMPYPVLSHSP